MDLIGPLLDLALWHSRLSLGPRREEPLPFASEPPDLAVTAQPGVCPATLGDRLGLAMSDTDHKVHICIYIYYTCTIYFLHKGFHLLALEGCVFLIFSGPFRAT